MTSMIVPTSGVPAKTPPASLPKDRSESETASRLSHSTDFHNALTTYEWGEYDCE